MKQKDIALIIVIVFVSAVLSLFVSKAIFSSPENRQQTAEVVQPITADFPKPDTRYFNTQAFDPTKVITVGDNANPNPFSSNNAQ
jgi:hypothetical protein